MAKRKKKKPVTQYVMVSYMDDTKGKIYILIDGVKVSALKPKIFAGIDLNLN